MVRIGDDFAGAAEAAIAGLRGFQIVQDRRNDVVLALPRPAQRNRDAIRRHQLDHAVNRELIGGVAEGIFPRDADEDVFPDLLRCMGLSDWRTLAVEILRHYVPQP